MPGIILPGFPPVPDRSYPNNNPLNPRGNTPALGPSPVTSLTGGGIATDARGRQTNMGFNPKDPESVRRVQKFLQGKGYKVKVDGKWGKLSQSAFDNFTVKPGEKQGTRNSELWNAKNGMANTPDVNHPKVDYPPTKYPPANRGGGGTPTPGAGTSFGMNMSGYNPNVASPITQGMLGAGPSLYDVKGGANSLAGIQFDPQIHDAQVQQSHIKPDTAQHLADIGAWYQQALGSLGKAKGRNETMFKNTTNEAGAAARDIVSSMGGDANMAAGVVGQAGADNAAEIAQMGAAESAYQNDLAPLINAEMAGQKTSESARQSQLANSVANNLINLRGQRGQSEAGYRLQLQGNNNDILTGRQQQLMERLKYNNDVSQQNFGNSMSIAQTALAAAMQGAQIDNIKASTTATKKQGSFRNWVDLDPGTRDNLIKSAMAQSLDPTSLGLMKGVTPLQAWQRARQYLIGQGYTSAHAQGNGPLAGAIPNMQAHNQIQNMLGAAIAAARQRATNAGTSTV